MTNPRSSSKFTLLLLVVAFAGSVLALHGVNQARGKQATLEDTLYITSGKTLKRLSLGYSGLLADIYWTRAVQYFGQKVQEDEPRYDLLYPLLDVTSDLDPHLIVVYEFGSVFLSQKPPTGAGQPEKAAALVEKGIRANPDYWRLYFTLGCIHYFDRKDYRAAQEAFEKGSEIPGALSWMKVMAATMAQHAGETSTAISIWTRIYETTQDEMIKKNAVQHLAALQADQNVAELQHRVALFKAKTGRLPVNWSDLIAAGFLKGIPLDPVNAPYRLMPDGTVQVQNPDKLPFITTGLPPGWKKSTRH